MFRSSQCSTPVGVIEAGKAHILGRGEEFGANKANPFRAVFSSVYNFCPLDRAIHAGPHRDHVLMRRLFLEIATEKVDEAIRRGDYQLTILDTDFVKTADLWLRDRPC